jgi:hypothetical protein
MYIPDPPDDNTFLTAGMVRGIFFRLFLHAIRVISEIGASNVEPTRTAQRTCWTDLKYFNFIDRGFTITGTNDTTVYNVQSSFDDGQISSKQVLNRKMTFKGTIVQFLR